MLMSVRRVFVIQQLSTGLFLNEDLHFVRLLREAGRDVSAECARETGEWNIGGGDFEVIGFYEKDDSSKDLFCPS